MPAGSAQRSQAQPTFLDIMPASSTTTDRISSPRRHRRGAACAAMGAQGASCGGDSWHLGFDRPARQVSGIELV
jgi:hypothetical protein